MTGISDESSAAALIELTTSPLDRLNAVLESFSLQTRALTDRTSPFARRFGERWGNLHVLREGSLEVLHPGAAGGLPPRMRVEEPTLLLYLGPVEHVLQPVEAVTMTCAEIELTGGPDHPLARALPPLVAVPIRSIPGLSPALELLCAEVDQVQCGHRVLADRLFEVVLIQLLRWLIQRPAEAGLTHGLFLGLADPQIARVLVAVHERPQHQWTLATMAELAGMSRTAFSERFGRLMGRPPAAYVADWRISLAQDRIRRGEPVGLVASELGYADASTFSRAFAARTGQAPREWRRTLAS